MIDHRTNPRLLPPYTQLDKTIDKCESCAVALCLQWLHPYGGYAPGTSYGHSRAFLTWLAAKYQREGSFEGIVKGLQEIGTVAESTYQTIPVHSNDREPNAGVLASAEKVIGGLIEIPIPKDIPIFLEEGPVIARLPWYDSFKNPGSDGIVQSVRNGGWNYHYVAIVGLVEKNGQPHYVISPHRGTGYGDGGYCYANKRWIERIGNNSGFYQLLPIT